MSQRKPHERLFDLSLFAMVPIVVYSMMVVHWLLDPFFGRERICGRLLPDLARFPSATSRKLALICARGGSILVQLLIGATQIALVPSALYAWRSRIAPAVPNGVSHTAAGLVVALVAWWGFWWLDVLRIVLLREATLRALRKRLIRIGLPTCVPCGRNLKGIRDGVCPDCGAVAAA